MALDLCQLVADLLPLYLEGEVAPSTREFISSHLEDCAACRRLCESCSTSVIRRSELRATPSEPDAIERRAASLLRRLKRTVVAGTAALVLVVAVTSLASYYSGAALARRFEKAQSLGLFTEVNVTRRCGARLIRLEKMLADPTATSFVFHERTELAGLSLRLQDDGGYEYDARSGSWITEEGQKKVAVFEPVREGASTLTLTFTDLSTRQRVRIEIDLPAEALSKVHRAALGLSRVYAPGLTVDAGDARLSLDGLRLGITQSVVEYSVSWRDYHGVAHGWPGGTAPAENTGGHIQLWEGKTRVRQHAGPTALAEFPQEKVALGSAVFDPVASFVSTLTIKVGNLYGYFDMDVRLTSPITTAGCLISQTLRIGRYRLALCEIRREGPYYILSYDVTDTDEREVPALIEACLEPAKEMTAAPPTTAVTGISRPGSPNLFFPADQVERLLSGRFGTGQVVLRVTRLTVKFPPAELSVPLSALTPVGEDPQEKQLADFLITAFARRLKVLSGEEPESVLTSFFSRAVLEDPAIRAAYLDRTAWAQAFAFGRPLCNYKVRPGPLKQVAADRAVAVLHDSWLARYGPREEDACGFSTREHRVTVEKTSKGWLITSDRFPWP